MFRNAYISAAIFSCIFAIALSDRKQDALFSEYGAHRSQADFYSDEFLNGQQTNVETRGACKNLPKSWQNRAMSVDTKGTCIKGCDDTDCKGTCKYIYPNNGEQQLSQIGLSRKIVSVEGCFRGRA